jgi:phosphocarrier protein
MLINADFRPDELQSISQSANRFSADIKIKFEEQKMTIDAKSLLGMMLFPIRRGTSITIQTKGADEEEAIEAMYRLLRK